MMITIEEIFWIRQKRLNGPIPSNPSEGMQTQESGSDPPSENERGADR